MRDDPRALMVQTWRHRQGWIIVRFGLPFSDNLPWPLDLMLNTGRPRTAVSASTRDALTALGHVDEIGRNVVRLHGLQLGGEPVPPLIVQVSAGPALLGLEGMLGLDFLDRYAEVRFDTRALRLTLIRA